VDDVTWQYPIFMVIAFAIGLTFYWLLTRSDRFRAKSTPARECARCKLAVSGPSVESYRHCPYCGARYS
jgi:hypothetical protein